MIDISETFEKRKIDNDLGEAYLTLIVQVNIVREKSEQTS